MQVIATAGHVDHGKSTLIRALTGMEPDRWAEERRRGMTIDLGYAWTRLPSGSQVAFVDVPGHERFTSNMLAGVGPAPAVLLVIAADAGWAAQTEEHVRALHALGVRHGLVAITRCDLADPAAAEAEAQLRLRATSLAGLPAVRVSGTTGAGLNDLRDALDELVARLPATDPGARVRLWVDRAFTIRGIGTVVTGTLAAGTLRRGDSLELGGTPVAVRGLQCLGIPADQVSGPARVAVNLRGLDPRQVHRGDALLTPRAWQPTRVLDVRAEAEELPGHVMLHVGAAAVPARVRPLGGGASATATRPGEAGVIRLLLDAPLPLQVGDRVLLRDPGRRQVLGGATVLDPAPPALGRRGAARARAAQLATDDGTPDLGTELRRRGAVPLGLLRAIGVPVSDPLPRGTVAVAGWLCEPGVWDAWQRALWAAVAAGPGGTLLDAGVGSADLVRALRLPDAQLLGGLIGSCSELEEVRGRVRQRGASATLRPDLEAAVARLVEALRQHPFAAPEQPQLAALGLGRHELGAAAAAGAVLRLPGDVVLLPDAPQRAVAQLRTIPQPFTLSAARQALSTTRRVAVPLLEHLDSLGLTARVDSAARRLIEPARAAVS